MTQPFGKYTKDPIPNIRAAGKIISTGGDSTEACIRADALQKGD